MGIDQYFDAAMKMKSQPKGADDPPYVAPRGHDKEMTAFERSHTFAKIRHGQDALGKIKMGKVDGA